MKRITFIVIMIAVVSARADYAPVEGTLGLSAVESGAAIAIWVPLADNEALSGFDWFNNDEFAVFPDIRVVEDLDGSPAPLAEGTVVGANISGPSSSWCQLFFDTLYSGDGGLFVVFRLPPGSVWTDDGDNGGPGIGIQTDGGGLAGWATWNGQDWVRLHPDISLTLAPRVVPGTAGKSLTTDDTPSITTTMIYPASPNPFNPSTTVRFQLHVKSRVEMQVVDLRGRVVATLIDEIREPGLFEVVWDGTDTNQYAVSSGVYMARLIAVGKSMTTRLVLVR